MAKNNSWNFDTTFSAGDILYASDANTLSKLNIGSSGQVLTVLSGLPSWQNANYPYYDTQTVSFFDDCIGMVPQKGLSWSGGGQNGMTSSNPGTAANTQSPTSAHPGVYSISTGTSSSANSDALTGTNLYLFGGGSYDFSWWAQIPTLSTSAQRFTIRMGYSDNISGSFTNGIWFEYIDNANSGNWVIKTMKASSTTSANTSTAASTSWTKFTISVNAAATSVSFLINDVAVSGSPLSTNIPNTVPVGMYWSILKSVGTTARTLNLDFYQFLIQLTNQRY